MSIIKIHKQKNFSIISNIPLNDKSISFKAKGIWAYLMSKPEDWEVRISNLINTSTEGRDAIYSGIKELVNAGYMNKIQHRDESGKMTGIEYQVFEDPMNRPLEPDPENPDSDNRDSDNRTQLKTDIPLPNTDLKNDDVPDQADPDPTPQQEGGLSSSFDYEKDLVSTLGFLMIMIPEKFQKPSISNVLSKALTTHDVDSVKTAIQYTNTHSTGETLTKYKSYLSKCIENHWHDGWTPDQDKADQTAIINEFRKMPDNVIRMMADAGNQFAINEIERRAGAGE